MRLHHRVSLILFCGAGLALARPQDPPTPVPVPQAAPSAEDAQRELRELFAKVEKRMQAIDALLYDAAAGETRLEQFEESGIGDLLRHTQSQSRKNLEDIDRILELARQSSQQQQQQQQQGSQDPQSGGQSPLDEPRDRTNQAQEQTPEEPDGQPNPMPPGQEEEEGNPPPPPGAENREGGPPEASRPGPEAGGQAGDRWGDLPPHVREIFRSQGGGDMPVRYRDWIDAYYRRLNQNP